MAKPPIFKIPDNAAEDLPVGVPRTVDINGKVICIEPTFTSRAYEQETFRLLIEEANSVAHDLRLLEPLPIAATNIVYAYVGRFGYNYLLGGLGNISTTNYWYFVEKGYKFNDVSITKIDEHCRNYSEKYQLPIERLDKTAAYQLATQWLASARMDVRALNRDFDVDVALDGYWNNVKMGELPKKKFAPLYIVSWLTKGQPHYSAGGGAYVELFLPTKTLLTLSVDDPKYILRQPVVITNLASLFPGKGEVITNYPAEPKIIVSPPPN